MKKILPNARSHPGSLFREAGKYISKTLRQWGIDFTFSCGEPELPVLHPIVESQVRKTFKG